MLSQEDRLKLAEIEQRLLADDPRFVGRMRAARHPWRPDIATVVLIGLWIAALVFAIRSRSMLVLGALFAVLVIETGWRAYHYRHRAP